MKIRMTICHGIPWYRNVADNHCLFSIEGWWLFFYPLSYLTLTLHLLNPGKILHIMPFRVQTVKHTLKGTMYHTLWVHMPESIETPPIYALHLSSGFQVLYCLPPILRHQLFSVCSSCPILVTYNFYFHFIYLSFHHFSTDTAFVYRTIFRTT